MASSRTRRKLDPVGSAAGLTLLPQGSTNPLFRGVWPDGFDYVCGVCGEMVIAESVVDGAIWDLAFRCFSCGGLSACPSFPPGEPLPRPVIAMAAQEFPPSKGTVYLKKSHVIVGMAAVVRRARETGRPQPPTSMELSPEALESLIDRTQALLGDTFQGLAKTDQRILTHGKGKADRHRLMELVEGVRWSAKNLRDAVATIDGISIVELSMSVNLLERWRNDPAFAGIVRTFANPPDFPHAIITLAAASNLTDAGNGVGLYVTDPKGMRPADLWLASGVEDRMAVEVKAPIALQKRHGSVSMKEARRIVETALKKAGSGASGQLRPERPGVLLVGGFHLRKRDVDMLEGAATYEFARRPGKRNHIAGMLTLTVGLTARNVALNPRGLVSRPNTTLHDTIIVRFARNPSYDRPLQIVESAPPPQ